MAPALRCLPGSLARSLRALSGARTTNFSGLCLPGGAQSPAAEARSPGRSAGGGESQLGAEQVSLTPAPRPSLGLQGPAPSPLAYRANGRGSSARAQKAAVRGGRPPAVGSRRARLRTLPLVLTPPGAPCAAEAAVQAAAGCPLCWLGLRALASLLPALPPAPNSARGEWVAMAAAPALHKWLPPPPLTPLLSHILSPLLLSLPRLPGRQQPQPDANQVLAPLGSLSCNLQDPPAVKARLSKGLGR